MTAVPMSELAAPTADEARALFDRARNGDAPALRALCVLMRPRLMRVAYAVLHDGDEADDVAQEALLRALKRHALFVGRGSLTGWMTRIALNLARNRKRDRARRRHLLESAGVDEKRARGALAQAPRAPDAVLAADEERARLRAALLALPPRQREVVELLVIGDLECAEVARLLGISEANARMALSLAKKKLASLLGAPLHGGSDT